MHLWDMKLSFQTSRNDISSIISNNIVINLTFIIYIMSSEAAVGDFSTIIITIATLIIIFQWNGNLI